MQWFCQLFWLLFLLVFAKLVAAEPFHLTGVKYPDKSANQLLFQLSGAAHHRYFTLTKPNRLVVDFIDTASDTLLPQPDVNHPLFINIRSGIRDGKNLRIVLELKTEVDTKGYLAKFANSSEFQFEVTPKLATTNAVAIETNKTLLPVVAAVINPAVKPVTTIASETTSPVVTPKSLKPITPAKVANVTVKPAILLPTKAKGRDIIVAIDAGHGGKDVGAQGNYGTQEKDVVFAIAQRLENLVNNQPGLKAVMIRRADYFVKLQERVRLAHEAKADLFISIHADAFNDSSAHGASVYTLANKGASSADARWLADSENASDLIGGGLADKNDTLASVLQDLSHTAAKQASQNIGSNVLKHVRSVGHLHRSSVQKAGFVVLKSPDIPSILVETAFISNPEEENRLNSRAYQDKMASAVYAGIIAHFHQYAPANTLFAQLTKSGKQPRLLAVKQLPDNNTVQHTMQARLPATNNTLVSTTNQHVINRGETLLGIAQHYGVSMRALRLANNMNDGNVKVGNVLVIPNNS